MPIIELTTCFCETIELLRSCETVKYCMWKNRNFRENIEISMRDRNHLKRWKIHVKWGEGKITNDITFKKGSLWFNSLLHLKVQFFIWGNLGLAIFGECFDSGRKWKEREGWMNKTCHVLMNDLWCYRHLLQQKEMESEKWKPGIREQTPDRHTDLDIRFCAHGNKTRNWGQENTQYNHILKMNPNRHISTE